MAERTHLSRRNLLRGIVTAAAAPAFIPSSVLGADSPNDRITLGVIGMGKRSGSHLGYFLHADGVQVVACCDVETKRLKKAKNRVEKFYSNQKGTSYSGCDTYTDFRELLARDDIDGVVICTPDHWHAVPVVLAARAGKDIYCEKPLTCTIEEGQRMREAVRRHGVVFQTGSQQRAEYGGKFRFACEMVRSGRIGELKKIRIHVGGPSSPFLLPAQEPMPTLDWDMWVGPAYWTPYNSKLCPDHTRGFPAWRYYLPYGGGAMCDWGAHHFDIAQWGLGRSRSGPVEVIPPEGHDVEHLTYRYDSGVIMTRGGGKYDRGVEFVGTDGRIQVDRGHLRTHPPELRRTPTRPDEVHLYNANSQQGNWLSCVRTRKEPICPVEIGHRSATVCHLGNIAYRTGTRVKWDPENERIIDNPEAERWVSRANREPWSL
jgi:predicted dehydrogenase